MRSDTQVTRSPGKKSIGINKGRNCQIQYLRTEGYDLQVERAHSRPNTMNEKSLSSPIIVKFQNI